MWYNFIEINPPNEKNTCNGAHRATIPFPICKVPGGPPAGTRGPGANLNQGHVFGKVVDEMGKPVEFASVVLAQMSLNRGQGTQATKQHNKTESDPSVSPQEYHNEKI